MLHPTPTLKETPSQTAGPYVHIGMTPNICGITGVIAEDLGKTMIHGDVEGERIKVAVNVFDGAGVPLFDGVVERRSQGKKNARLSPCIQSRVSGFRSDDVDRGCGNCRAGNRVLPRLDRRNRTCRRLLLWSRAYPAEFAMSRVFPGSCHYSATPAPARSAGANWRGAC